MYNCNLSAKLLLFFSSNSKNSSHFIHRSSIQHWKKGLKSFYQHECFISKKHFCFENISVFINIVVERVPCCIWTSNGLALTMLMVPDYWLIENQSRCTNESRNAMVLKYDLKIYSEVIRGIMHSFLS